METFESLKLDPEVGAVILGLDPEFTYSKLCLASLYINEQKCKFIVTNTDKFVRVNGRHYPSCGTILASVLLTLTDKSYELVGKPNQFAIEVIKEEQGLAGKRVLMVGDNPDTDIKFGNTAGVATCLVLTGVVASEAEWLEKWQGEGRVPTHVMASLGDFQ